jgi:hypothetical protein
MPSAAQFIAHIALDNHLDPGLEEINLKPKSVDLKEFQVLNANSEPQSFFTRMVEVANPKVPKRKFEEFKRLASSPGMSKKEFSTLFKRFKIDGRQEEIVPALEYQYDPSSKNSEMQNVGEFLKMWQHIDMVKKQEIWNIAMEIGIAMLPMILYQLVRIMGSTYEIVNIPEFPFDVQGIMITITLMKIFLQSVEFTQSTLYLKSELLRIRGSLTTGNVTGLLQRITQKLEYMERRTLKDFGNIYVMHMRLTEEFLDIPWKSQDAGTQKFGQIVAEFIEQKWKIGVDFKEVIYIYIYTFVK